MRVKINTTVVLDVYDDALGVSGSDPNAADGFLKIHVCLHDNPDGVINISDGFIVVTHGVLEIPNCILDVIDGVLVVNDGTRRGL